LVHLRSLAGIVGGCWRVQVFIDDIDGVGPTNGLIGSRRVPVDSGTFTQGEETATRCFETTFQFPAGSVGAGVYDLCVIITLSSSSCDDPGPLVQDMVGWAQVPALFFACHDWMRRSGSWPEASWASPGQESDRPALNVTGGLAGVPQIRSAK
jgi:hypothetical protein